MVRVTRPWDMLDEALTYLQKPIFLSVMRNKNLSPSEGRGTYAQKKVRWSLTLFPPSSPPPPSAFPFFHLTALPTFYGEKVVKKCPKKKEVSLPPKKSQNGLNWRQKLRTMYEVVKMIQRFCTVTPGTSWDPRNLRTKPSAWFGALRNMTKQCLWLIQRKFHFGPPGLKMALRASPGPFGPSEMGPYLT